MVCYLFFSKYNLSSRSHYNALVCFSSSFGLYWSYFFRLIKGIGITSPGRDHIHHKLMLNYSPEGALGIILLISLCTGLLGITLENNFEPWVSTFMFLLFASFYYIYAYGFKNLKRRLVR